jgi:formylglycine-generating enzyme required for sulfatase activity
VLRGGSWNYFPMSARASLRIGNRPEFRDVSLGFRCVREVIPQDFTPAIYAAG